METIEILTEDDLVQEDLDNRSDSYRDIYTQLLKYTDNFTKESGIFPAKTKTEYENTVKILKDHYVNANKAGLDYSRTEDDGTDYKVEFSKPIGEVSESMTRNSSLFNLLLEEETPNEELHWHKTPYGFSEAKYKNYVLTKNTRGDISVDFYGDEVYFKSVKDALDCIDTEIKENINCVKEDFGYNDLEDARLHANDVHGTLKSFDYTTGESLVSFKDGSFRLYDADYNQLPVSQELLDEIIENANDVMLNNSRSNSIGFAEKQLRWATSQKTDNESLNKISKNKSKNLSEDDTVNSMMAFIDNSDDVVFDKYDESLDEDYYSALQKAINALDDKEAMGAIFSNTELLRAYQKVSRENPDTSLGYKLSKLDKLKNESLNEGAVDEIAVYDEYDESLDEAAKHDELNPDIWGEDKEIKPEVKDKLLEIVQKFDDNLKQDGIELDVKDVVIIGSNANYNYTDVSDIDLHIVCDTSVYENQEDLAMKCYQAYKSLFNNKYDPTIKGHEVEIYVEPDAIRANSNGMYSLNSGWLKEPVKDNVPEFDKKELEDRLKPFVDRFNNVETLEDADQLLDDIYLQRQQGILKDGEFSIENQIFKEFRNEGYLDKLKEKKTKLETDEMSLESLEEDTDLEPAPGEYDKYDDAYPGAYEWWVIPNNWHKQGYGRPENVFDTYAEAKDFLDQNKADFKRIMPQEKKQHDYLADRDFYYPEGAELYDSLDEDIEKEYVIGMHIKEVTTSMYEKDFEHEADYVIRWPQAFEKNPFDNHLGYHLVTEESDYTKFGYKFNSEAEAQAKVDKYTKEYSTLDTDYLGRKRANSINRTFNVVSVDVDTKPLVDEPDDDYYYYYGKYKDPDSKWVGD